MHLISYRRRTACLGIGLIVLSSCGGGGSPSPTPQSASVVRAWDSLLLDGIVDARLGPPMTARAIGMVHTCMFDAWAAYDAKAVGTRLGGTLRRPLSERTLANKERAVSFAAYRALVDLFPADIEKFKVKMTQLGYDPSDVSTDTSTPQGIGNVTAKAVLDFRHHDGSNQLGDLHSGAYSDYTGYVPVNTPTSVVDPQYWQQIMFGNGASPSFVGPFWGNVIPFSLTSGSEFRPPAPPAFGTPTYLSQLQQVLDLQAGLNDRTKTIAEYWADGPGTVQPPGHWCRIAQYVSERQHYGIDDDVKMFFLLGNAEMDAGIACWDAKRVYNTSRPYTATHFLYAGKQVTSFVGGSTGFAKVDGSLWMPYQSANFITPPFPEYTSGHSTFSAAGAEILMRYTGNDNFGMSATIGANSSSFESGVPASAVTLHWDTFTDAANEAGISRLYGGIHYDAANREGAHCGRMVGEKVWEVGTQYIDGTAVGARTVGDSKRK